MLNKLSMTWIDFGAAIIGGLVVSCYSQYTISFIKPVWSTYEDFLFTAIYVFAFVIAALVVLRWKTAITVKIGWALIAFVGATLCATADELASRASSDGAFRDVFMLPIGVIIYSLLTLPAMALIHYLALTLSDDHPETK